MRRGGKEEGEGGRERLSHTAHGDGLLFVGGGMPSVVNLIGNSFAPESLELI